MIRRSPSAPGSTCLWTVWAVLAALVSSITPAFAFLDVEEHGPTLHAGDFNLRVTNAGVLGNPFTDRSFDPSFEYPKGSGQEFMRSAALWVGALDDLRQPHVSGGPMLEWRPTPARDDTVIEAWHGRPGSLRLVDDDNDGSVDEEVLNNRDDDGDGEVDEDIGMVGQQMLAADYVDDRPEAIGFQYQGYEQHVPIGLSVHQEAYAWSTPGYRGIAGLSFKIKNHTTKRMHDLYVGLFVDWDVHKTRDPSADVLDDIERASVDASIFKGTAFQRVGEETLVYVCFHNVHRSLPIVHDRRTGPDAPAAGVLPLDHKRDPIGFLYPPAAHAPGGDSFRVTSMSADRSAQAGGIPRNDAERYAALSGDWSSSPDDWRGDQAVLVSCGPFQLLDPGDSIQFDIALAVGPALDSLRRAMSRAAVVYEGVELNRIPDVPGDPLDFHTAISGQNGHEACVEPPPGYSFVADPDCVKKLSPEISPDFKTYLPGACIWTDADCNICTGLGGRETVVRWRNPAAMPPNPEYRVTARDHSVRVEWDNMPEILLKAGKAGPPNSRFIGYHVYRLSDWRDRGSLLPEENKWGLVRGYGSDSTNGMIPIATITDTTLQDDHTWYEQPHYPPGRYAIEDRDVANGFDYLYSVTTVVESRHTLQGIEFVDQFESPLLGEFWQRVTPRAEAQPDAAGVWVVPNPYRAKAGWERSPIADDRLTRHLDFMGLPHAPCTIRIYTVAGDLVAELHHDGSRGDGEEPWNLISRNGQDVVSGIYTYRVESSLGSSTGRFVVIR